MRRWIRILPVALLLATVAYGQSLGDVARETRQKQKNKKEGTAKKVITNETLPSSGDDGPAVPSSPTAGQAKSSSATAPSEGKTSAAEWKNRIQAQKNAVSNLQQQIDKLDASIHFVVANEYYNGVEYNQEQVRKQEQVAQMRQRHAEEKKKLEEMQEAARQAGMGSAVYDP